MILAILHSASAPGMNEPDADLLIQQACGAVLRCSVRDADLPHRVSIIMDTFWSIRHLVPSIGQAPQGRVDRLAAGVTFWCLHRFRTSLQSAEKSTDRVNKALEIMRKCHFCHLVSSNLRPCLSLQYLSFQLCPLLEGFHV